MSGNMAGLPVNSGTWSGLSGSAGSHQIGILSFSVMADLINMGQTISHSPSNQYSQDSLHSHSWREKFADGLMPVDEMTDEVMTGLMNGGSNISFRARDTPKHKGRQTKFLIWVAFSRRYTPGIEAYQLQLCPVAECKKFIANPEALRQHVYNCQDLAKGHYRCFDCNKDVRIRDYHEHKRKPQAVNGQPKRGNKRSLRSNISLATRSLFSIHESNNYHVPAQPTQEQTRPHDLPQDVYAKSELFCEQNTYPNELDSMPINRMDIRKSTSSDPSFTTDHARSGATILQMMASQSCRQDISRQSAHSESKDKGCRYLGDARRDDSVEKYTPPMPISQSFHDLYSTSSSIDQHPHHNYRHGMSIASLSAMRNLSHTHPLSVQTYNSILSPSSPCGNKISDLPSPLTSPIDQRNPEFIDQIISPAGSISDCDIMTQGSTATSLSIPSANVSMSVVLNALPVAADSKSFVPMIEDSNLEFDEPEEIEEDVVQIPVVESELTQFMRHATIESCASALEENHWDCSTGLDHSSLDVDSVVPVVSGGTYVDSNAATQTSEDLFDNLTWPLKEEWSIEENEAWDYLINWRASSYFSKVDEGETDGHARQEPAQLVTAMYSLPIPGPDGTSPPQIYDHTEGSLSPSKPVEDTRAFHILKPAPLRTASSDSTQSETATLVSPTMTAISTPSSTQSSSSDLNFRCPHCHHEPSGLQKNKKANLKRHQKYHCPLAPNSVGNSKTYKCNYEACDKGFTRPDALLVHRRDERHEIKLAVFYPEHENAFKIAMREDVVQGGIYDGTGYGDDNEWA